MGYISRVLTTCVCIKWFMEISLPKLYSPKRWVLIMTSILQKDAEVLWVKKLAQCPRTSREQRLDSHPGLSKSRDFRDHQETKMPPPRRCRRCLLAEDNLPNRLQVSALQPWPPCLAGELARCLCVFQTQRGVNFSELGSRREDEFSKHRRSLPQHGVAGYRLLCLLAVETKICSAEEFYNIQRTASVAFPTSEKSKCQATGFEW